MDLHRSAQLPYSSTVAGEDVAKLGGVINSVENFQILPNPSEAQAAEPPHEGERSLTATVEDRNHHDHHLEVGDKNVINNNAAEMDVHPEEDDEGVGGEKDKRNELDLGSINRGVHGADGMVNEDFVAYQEFDDLMEEHVEGEDGKS